MLAWAPSSKTLFWRRGALHLQQSCFALQAVEPNLRKPSKLKRLHRRFDSRAAAGRGGAAQRKDWVKHLGLGWGIEGFGFKSFRGCSVKSGDGRAYILRLMVYHIRFGWFLGI